MIFILLLTLANAQETIKKSWYDITNPMLMKSLD